MDSHPDRDDDLADVVDELEDNVTNESDGVPDQKQPSTAGAEQEPPD